MPYRSHMTAEHEAAFPDVVEIVVEIPRGSRNKYEFDEVAGVFRLNRVLSSAVFYNFDYGFIEGTRADDGDHTDALLVIDEPTFTGCHVWARPIGGLEMRDEMGFDFKVLCVAIGDPHQAHIERLDQVRPHRLVEIEHFFETYKMLENKATDVVGWRDLERGRTRSCAPTARPGAGSAATAAEPRDRRWRYPPGAPGDLRVFVAVPLGDAARAAVRALVDRVAGDPRVPAARRLRWAVTDNLHLTIRFLGPTAPDRVPDVAAAAEAAAARLAPFEVRIGGAGAFPTAERPRVVWLGIAAGTPPLRRARGGARRRAGRTGLAPRRAPVPRPPHAGPGRRGPRRRRAPWRALAEAATGLDAAWTADRLVVYESDLGHRPARYRPLSTALLRGDALPRRGPLG